MSGAGERRVELNHFDLVELGGAFRVCDMSMVLLGHEEASRAVLGSSFEDGVVLCSGKYDFSFRGRFRLPQDWCLLGYVHETSPGSWCHGVDLEPGMSITLLAGGVSEIVLKAGTCWSVALMPVSRLRLMFDELATDATDFPVNRMMLFDAGGSVPGRKLHKRFDALRAHFVEGDGSPLGHIDNLLRDHILAGLASARSPDQRRGRGRRTHYRVVRRVEDFMFANLRSDINNAQLCNVACTSERTLRYAFDDVLGGVSPKRFLSLLRLCEACRHLAIADMSRRSVKSVALSCGLWDLSRFAENYRHLFGELPRQTLKRHDSHASSDDPLRQAIGIDRFAWDIQRMHQAG